MKVLEEIVACRHDKGALTGAEMRSRPEPRGPTNAIAGGTVADDRGIDARREQCQATIADELSEHTAKMRPISHTDGATVEGAWSCL